MSTHRSMSGENLHGSKFNSGSVDPNGTVQANIVGDTYVNITDESLWIASTTGTDDWFNPVTSTSANSWGNITGALSAQTDLQNALDEKATITYVDTVSSNIQSDIQPLSDYYEIEGTGVLKGGLLSVNSGNNSLFDIEEAIIAFEDNTDMENVVYTKVTIPATSGLDPDLVGFRNKWIGIQLVGGNPQFVYDEEFTQLEHRSIAIVGRCFGPGDGTLSSAKNYTHRSWGTHGTVEDLTYALGSLNVEGNIYTPNDGNLLMDKSEGVAFRADANYASEPTSPNILTDLVQSPVATYQYHVFGASTTSALSAIDPNNYDNGGVKTAVENNKWTVQAVYFFPGSGTTHVVYGQNQYNSLNEAKANFIYDGYNLNTGILKGSILRAYVFIVEGATSLSNPAQALIIDAANALGSVIEDGTVTETSTSTLTNKTITDINNTVYANRIHYKVKSVDTGIEKGTPLMYSNYDDVLDLVEVVKSDNTSGVTIGVAGEAITNGSTGTAVMNGILDFMSTSAWSANTILYPNNTGGWTDTKPTTGYAQMAAYVQNSDATNGILQINVGPPLQNASNVSYDNTSSSLSSTNVQDAIDELDTNVTSLSADVINNTNNISTLSASTNNVSASDVYYDNTNSGMSATDVQDAIDELRDTTTSADSNGFPIHNYGWRDNVASLASAGKGSQPPTWKAWNGGIWAYHFAASGQEESLMVTFHIDHDWAPGTDMYPHVHWTPTDNNAGVVRWGLEYTIAKGHQQEAFSAPTTIYLEQACSGTNFHQIVEATSAQAIPASACEVDSLVSMRVFRDTGSSNDTYDNSEAVGLMVDLHYQSDREVTLNKAPDFYN